LKPNSGSPFHRCASGQLFTATQGQISPDSAPLARHPRLSPRINQRFPANAENSHIKIMHVLFFVLKEIATRRGVHHVDNAVGGLASG
jgi:hypothetical protein